MQSKARSFMFVAVGVLALALAYAAGSQRAAADSNPNGWGNVRDVVNDGHSRFFHVLTTSGEFWAVSDGNGWQMEAPASDLPVALEQIAYWSQHSILTTTGDAWFKVGGLTWTNYGHCPAEPVPAGRTSVGGIKSKW